VDLAVSLAGDLPRLADLRAGLRERMATAPLCDGKRFTTNLALILQGLWDNSVCAYLRIEQKNLRIREGRYAFIGRRSGTIMLAEMNMPTRGRLALYPVPRLSGGRVKACHPRAEVITRSILNHSSRSRQSLGACRASGSLRFRSQLP